MLHFGQVVRRDGRLVWSCVEDEDDEEEVCRTGTRWSCCSDVLDLVSCTRVVSVVMLEDDSMRTDEDDVDALALFG